MYEAHRSIETGILCACAADIIAYTAMDAEAAVQAFFRAVCRGEVDEVGRRLDAEPHLMEAINELEWIESTPLMLAAREGHVAMVRLLLERRGAVNAGNSDGVTPLYLAALEGHEEVVSLLLERGADTSRTIYLGYTPLSIASRNGHLGVTRQLLQHVRGSGLEERSMEGTALRMACKYGHVEIARALLLAGAVPLLPTVLDAYEDSVPRAVTLPSVALLQVSGTYSMLFPKTGGGSASEHCFLSLVRIYNPSYIFPVYGVLVFDFWVRLWVMFVQWWEGELERAYYIHRARRMHEDGISRQQAPTATVPAYVRTRVGRKKRFPRVHVIGENGGRATRASAKRGRGATGEEPSEEEEKEKGAMLKYVIHDLAQELYTELFAGFHT
jgi:hypothetical protein